MVKNISPMQRRASDKKFKILCIDDESANLKILSTLFKDNYQVIACKQASEGVEKALSSQPDLILLDVIMPGVSGFELITQLKGHSDLKQIPVIFITGLQSPEDEEKGLKLGACDYIHKPFNPSIVMARVNTHLEIVRQRNLLERFANFDILTELPNRRKWEQDSADLAKSLSHTGSKLVVGIADIDFFKLYNDSYGHQQGDIALRKVASALARSLFDYHGHVYRCGGEEFYFYFPENQPLPIEDILDNCLETVRDLEIKHKSSLVDNKITVSIGAIKCQVTGEQDIKEGIGQADKLLYRMKQTGRNNFDYQALELA